MSPTGRITRRVTSRPPPVADKGSVMSGTARGGDLMKESAIFTNKFKYKTVGSSLKPKTSFGEDLN